MEIGDVKNAYDAVCLVESFIVSTCIDKITPVHLQKLEELNMQMIEDGEHAKPGEAKQPL